ncbi:MAG TPA: iron-sulfur cluster repair di-iron protein [Flavobacterium sp.]|nr:iron-sulfur cluster repair di-iron protein [Flavobacterium sp.]
MEFLKTTTVGEIVTADYKTAALFSKLGIDFCCQGNRTLEEACTQSNLITENIQQELQAIMTTNNESSIDFKTWELDLLADYVEKMHHRYVEEKTAVILPLLNKVCKVHGENHPELVEINQLFKESAQDLAAHMKKEELILFPFIRKMVKAKIANQPLEHPHFDTVENPIELMMHEHDAEGERFRRISELSSNYTAPEDACTSYKTVYGLLEHFEKDLHKHIHLENNILFPNSKVLEKTLN